jgi:thiosulfate/3-mercaptopyruvate sulfurtransferase
MDQLVSAAWLESQLGAEDLRIIESTSYLRPAEGKAYEIESGRADWEAGHIPGSAYADVNDELAEPHPSLNFTFPSAERFAAAMSALGVQDGTRVVLYDRGGPMWATRAWWLLRAYGFDDAAVLDGGWESWTGPVSTDPAPSFDATFTPRPRPSLIADRDEVLADVENGGVCLLNALSPAVHEGKETRYGRAGRIPGSVNVYAQHLVDPETRRFLPVETLRERLAVANDGRRVIAYCGGGISATVDAFALTLAGARDVAVYDGSMTEWLSDPSLPVETG